MPDEPIERTNAGSTQSHLDREKMREAAQHLNDAVSSLSHVLDKVREARNALYNLDISKPEQWSWYCAKAGVSKAEEELRKIEEGMIRYASDLVLPPKDRT